MLFVLTPTKTNQRTLEEMNLVFAADSIWNWEAEKNYRLLLEENPELVQAAQRGMSVVDPETGEMTRRRSTVPAKDRHFSLAARGSTTAPAGGLGEKHASGGGDNSSDDNGTTEHLGKRE